MCTSLTGVNETRIENASVLVEGNLIKSISSDAIEASGAVVIDGGGSDTDAWIHGNACALDAHGTQPSINGSKHDLGRFRYPRDPNG